MRGPSLLRFPARWAGVLALGLLLSVVGVPAAHAGPPRRPDGAVSSDDSAPPYNAVLIGDSITRKAKAEVLAHNPGMTVDALDGRSWVIRGRPHGTSLWEAFVRHRHELRANDWLILETARGDVPVDLTRRYADRLIHMLPFGACLAWVIPHTYYANMDEHQALHMAAWNKAMAAMIHAELAKVGCHWAIEWDSVVNRYTQAAHGLTAAQKSLSQPLCYDGRHPTPLGQRVYGLLIRQQMIRARAQRPSWPMPRPRF